MQVEQVPVASTSTLPHQPASPPPTTRASPSPHAPSKRVAPRILPSSGARTTNIFGSAKSASSALATSGAGGCRLLWRGKIVTADNKALHGIAIVAHLFAVPLLSPHQISAQPSPFDDPFSPSTASSGADMCLGIEMMKGRDLRAREEVQVVHKVQSGMAREGVVQVETPTDVRVYIDQRCPQTVEWFEKMFCVQGREGLGVKVDVGGEESIIFASYPSIPPSSSPSTFKPPLTLLLGRPSQLATRKPRPDDPMPRENLFANKLRRTNSLPALAFGFPPPLAARTSTSKPLARPKPRASKSLLSLLDRSAPSLDRSAPIAKGKEKAPPPIKSKPKAEPAKRARPPGVGTPGRRGPKRRMMVISDDEEEERGVGVVPGSPTPSVATTFGGEEEEEEDVEHGGGGKARGMKRSVSVPVGRFGIGEARGKSVVVEGVEGRNKAAIRKIVLARLTTRGVARDDERFKDVFAMTSKGVQFAFRDTFKTTPIDRTLATTFADSHLAMYVLASPAVSSSLVVKLESLEEGAEEKREVCHMPSPESLEVDEEEGLRERTVE